MKIVNDIVLKNGLLNVFNSLRNKIPLTMTYGDKSNETALKFIVAIDNKLPIDCVMGNSTSPNFIFKYTYKQLDKYYFECFGDSFKYSFNISVITDDDNLIKLDWSQISSLMVNSISSTASNSEIPSALAVKNYVDSSVKDTEVSVSNNTPQQEGVKIWIQPNNESDTYGIYYHNGSFNKIGLSAFNNDTNFVNDQYVLDEIKNKTDYVVYEDPSSGPQDLQQVATIDYVDETYNKLLGSYVTPEMFGAVGDGETDDSEAFRLAFASKKPVVGNRDKKYYVLDLEVGYPESGEGSKLYNCTFIRKNNELLNGTCLILKSSSLIENCKIANYDTAIGCSGTVVHSKISFTWISYCTRGIYLPVSNNNSINNLIITDCYINKCGEYADDPTKGDNNPTHSGLYLTGNIDGVQIHNNVFEYNTYSGIYIKNDNENFRIGADITGNYFEGNKYSAIFLHTTLTSNMIHVDGNFFSRHIPTGRVMVTPYIAYEKFASIYEVKDLTNISIAAAKSKGNSILDNNHYAIIDNNASSQYLELVSTYIYKYDNNQPVDNQKQIIYQCDSIAEGKDPIILYSNDTNKVEFGSFDRGYGSFLAVGSSFQLSRIPEDGDLIRITYYGKAFIASTKSAIEDITIDGNSIVQNGVAAIPLATSTSDFNTYKLFKVAGLSGGLTLTSGALQVYSAPTTSINNRSSSSGSHVITVKNLDNAVKAALTDGKGTAYTETQKTAARERIGAYAKPSTGIPASDLATGVIPTIPSALPNPNALTFTGAVTGTYDGSSPLSIDIPSDNGIWDELINFTAESELTIVSFAAGDAGQDFSNYSEMYVMLMIQPIDSSGTYAIKMSFGKSTTTHWQSNSTRLGTSGKNTDSSKYSLTHFRETPFGVVCDLLTGSYNSGSLLNEIIYTTGVAPLNFAVGAKSTTTDNVLTTINCGDSFGNIIIGSYTTCLGAGSQIKIYGKRK